MAGKSERVEDSGFPASAGRLVKFELGRKN
jgi:hypothetical protein